MSCDIAGYRCSHVYHVVNQVGSSVDFPLDMQGECEDGPTFTPMLPFLLKMGEAQMNKPPDAMVFRMLARLLLFKYNIALVSLDVGLFQYQITL